MNSALQVIGGLGLFLLGMSLMTEGLKALAGGSLRRALARFTKSPTSGAVTGAITTAVVQSSSITVITAVGFVGARLLTFPQALGVIFGANIGTTITGWIVVLVGFKFSLDEAMLPLVFIGALLHLFGRDRLAKIGFAIAGFGLVFVGIGMLQTGMAGAEAYISPDTLPPDTQVGRLLLVLIGAAITVVTQSSSAGVATAVAALSAGAISFEQAAAMVIGMDIGTTVTAALATIGGNTAVRRTGLAHVIYNLLTAIVAFIVLGLYVSTLDSIGSTIISDDPELSLVGFHTFFNALGVLLVLPFAGHFARLIERLFPEDPSSLVRHLSKSLRKDEYLALEATRHALLDVSRRLFVAVAALLGKTEEEPVAEILEEVRSAIASVDAYLAKVQTTKELGMANDAHLAVLHALDHLRNLVSLCHTMARGIAGEATRELRDATIKTLAHIQDEMEHDRRLEVRTATNGESLEEAVEEARHRTLKKAATGTYSLEKAEYVLNDLRWIASVVRHVQRIEHHLQEFPIAASGSPEPETLPDEPDSALAS